MWVKVRSERRLILIAVSLSRSREQQFHIHDEQALDAADVSGRTTSETISCLENCPLNS